MGHFMKIHHRLRTKIMVMFFSVTLIPALIIGIYAIQVSSKSLQEQALMTQTTQLKTFANNLTSFLLAVKGDLMFLSHSPLLKDYVNMRSTMSSQDFNNTPFPETLEPKRLILEQEFLALSHNRQMYYQIRYLDETGQEIVRVDSDSIRSQIIVRDKLQDKSNRYYFVDTVRLPGKQLFVSPLDLNRERGQIERPLKPVIRYSMNIYDDQNHKAGIVIINVDAKQFLKPLANTRLVNREGYFMNHPNHEKRWGGSVDLDTGYDLDMEYPQLAKQIRNKNGTISTDILTLSHLQVRIPGTSRYWMLIMQRDTADILKNVMEFRIIFTLILLLSVLIVLILAWVLSARITRPIEHLTHIAHAISQGELINNRVDIQDKGEIGQLAQAFERMRVSMIKSFERLRKQSSKS